MQKNKKINSAKALRLTPILGVILAALTSSAFAATPVYTYLKAAPGVRAEVAPTTPVETPANFVVNGTPASTFPSVPVDDITSLTISLRNSGTQAGSLTVPAFTGVNPGDFSASTTCNQVAGAGTCALTVNFSPKAIGARSASLAVGGTTVNFTGSGEAAPSDPSFAKVTALFHFDGNVIDSTGKTTGSGTGITYAAGRFGSGAAVFNGTTSYAQGSSLYNLASSTWTIEMWVNPVAFGGALMAQYASSDNQWNMGISKANALWMGGTTYTFANSMTANAWHHIAFVRSNGTTSAYVDGVRSTVTTTAPVNYLSGGYIIGSAWWGSRPSAVFSGAIDDLRITGGVARYTTATFAVPTRAFPSK